MNTYKTSTGERISKSKIDKLIRKAKSEKVREQFNDFGYNFCEQCGISSGTYLDCSHDISVKKCQEDGKSERAFNVKNLTILCRKCHQKKDKLDLKFIKH